MKRFISVGVLVLTMGTTGVALADEPPQSLREDIRELQARLAALEAQERENRMIPPTGGYGGIPQIIPGVNISGYADVSYTYSLNESNNFLNTARVFDTESHGFTPHAFELVFEKPISDEQPVGFRADLFTGDDASVIKATGLGASTTDVPFDLQQAYVNFRVPVGNGLDFKVGKFVTLLGAEVIESPANWNFSRSYMFGYSIPFTHTGLLASYPWTEWFSTNLGAVNGWDIVDDNNKAKTILGSFTLGPWSGLSWTTAYVVGAERANNNKDRRFVFSNILSWTPMEKLAFMVNYDYGWEKDAVGGAAVTGSDNAHWQGVAVYAKYSLTDRWALAGRWELFHDMDNYRVTNAGSGLDDVRYLGYTLTSEWKLYDKLIARLEYRLDQANAQVFRHDQGINNHQNTVSAELIYPF